MDLLPEACAYALDALLSSACPALAARLHSCGMHASALLPALLGTDLCTEAHSTLRTPVRDAADAVMRALYRIAACESALMACGSYSDMLRVLLNCRVIPASSATAGDAGGVSAAPDAPPRASFAAVSVALVQPFLAEYTALRMCMAGLMSAQLRTLHKGVRHALNLRTGGPPLRSAMARVGRDVHTHTHTHGAGAAPSEGRRSAMSQSDDPQPRTPSTPKHGDAHVDAQPASASPSPASTPASSRVPSTMNATVDLTATGVVTSSGSSAVVSTESARPSRAPSVTSTATGTNPQSLHLGPALGAPAMARFSLTEYDWIGFDLDHTLITYKQHECNRHMFYASLRALTETGARACATVLQACDDGKAGEQWLRKWTDLTEGQAAAALCAAALLPACRRLAEASTTDGVPHPSPSGLHLVAPHGRLRFAQVQYLAELVGQEAKVVSDVSVVPFPADLSRSHVVVDAKLGNVLLLDTAAVVVHATHGMAVLDAAAVRELYGDSALDGYAFGDATAAAAKSMHAQSSRRLDARQLQMPSARTVRSSPPEAAAPVADAPKVDATPAAADETAGSVPTPAPARAVRRFATVHTGFDECLPALVSSVVDAVDASLTAAGRTAADIDYTALIDACLESVRVCFSAYCSFGFNAVLEDLPRYVDAQPNVRMFLQTIRKLPLPLRQSSSNVDPMTFRMSTARTLTAASASTMGASAPLSAAPTVMYTRRMRIFLLTNAAWDHTNKLMSFAYGKDWLDLFDFVVTAATKKAFFSAHGVLNRSSPSLRGNLAADDGAGSAPNTSARALLRPVDLRTGKVVPSGASQRNVAVAAHVDSRNDGPTASVAWDMAKVRRAAEPVSAATTVHDLKTQKVFAGGSFDAVMQLLTAHRYCASPVHGGGRIGDTTESFGGADVTDAHVGQDDDDADASVCYMGDHVVHDVVAPTARGWHCVAVLPALRALSASSVDAHVRSPPERVTASGSSVSTSATASMRLDGGAPGFAPAAHSLALHAAGAPDRAVSDRHTIAIGDGCTRPSLAAGQIMRSAALCVPSVAFLAAMIMPALQNALRASEQAGVLRLPVTQTLLARDTALGRTHPGSASASSSTPGLLGWLTTPFKGSLSLDPAVFHSCMGKAVRAGRITTWHVHRALALPSCSAVAVTVYARYLTPQDSNATGLPVPRASSLIAAETSAVDSADVTLAQRSAPRRSNTRRPSLVHPSEVLTERDAWSAVWSASPIKVIADSLVNPHASSEAGDDVTLRAKPAGAVTPTHTASGAPSRRGRSPSAGSKTSEDAATGPARGSARSSSPASSVISVDDKPVGCLPWLFPRSAAPQHASQQQGSSSRSLLSTGASMASPRALDRGLSVGGAMSSCQRSVADLVRSRSWFVPVCAPASAAQSPDAFIVECAIMCGGPKDAPAWGGGADEHTARGLDSVQAPAMWRLLACRAIVDSRSAQDQPVA